MKTIITLDKADQPFGFPQGNEQGFLTGSKVFGPYGNNSVISSSWAATASFASSTNIPTGSYVTTSSFNAFTASYNTGSFSGSFVGSLIGTSSWSINAQNASTANDVNGYANATVDQINVGETSVGTYAYVVRAQELEESKHNTINIFNYLNFT